MSSLRVKNCPVNSAEWEDILKSVFEPEPLPDIQVAATIQAESSITLTVRKQVQGITVCASPSYNLTMHSTTVILTTCLTAAPG